MRTQPTVAGIKDGERYHEWRNVGGPFKLEKEVKYPLQKPPERKADTLILAW